MFENIVHNNLSDHVANEGGINLLVPYSQGKANPHCLSLSIIINCHYQFKFKNCL